MKMQFERYARLLIIMMVLVAVGKPLKAQYVLNEADKNYELYNYVKAIDLYEQAYQKKHTLHAAQQLGNCYALLNNSVEAESWYGIAIKMPGSKPENILNYAKALQRNGKYSEAKEQFIQFATAQKDVTEKQLNLWTASCDSAVIWMKNPKDISINNEMKLNSPQSDWGAGWYQNKLVFASDRGHANDEKETGGRPFLKFDSGKKPSKTVAGWTGRSYLRLYMGKDSVAKFPIAAGTSYHIGPASFSANGKEVFFAVTRIPKKPVYKKGKLATINIETYSSTVDDAGNWSEPTAFQYNKVDEYAVGDPFLSSDGKWLYFVSNMPGGVGGTDLYKSERIANGWGNPINLKELNTEGNERTPSIAEGTIYFSTDGRVGMGGLDVFEAKIDGDRFTAVKNLGYPINSAQDDFAFLKIAALTGYISSNRDNGSGEDDIYSFAKQRELVFKLAGRVFDKKTNALLPNAIVSLKKLDGQTLKVQTDAKGEFAFNLEKDADYELKGIKTGYRADTDSLSTRSIAANTTINKDLFLTQVEIDTPIRIENIYYDFDKSNIRKDASIELDKLVKIMKDNPNIWIELGSHTDSRGNDQYNQWLSQSRANSAVQYIIDRGIAKNRITAKGYGENKLLNKCANGVKCSEEQHQLNRRTEFKIVKQ